MQDSFDFFKVQILYQTVSDSSSDHKKSKIQFNAEPAEQILSNSPPSLASLGLIGDYDLCLKAAGRFIGLSPEQEKECKEFEYDEGILVIRKNEKLILIYKGLPDTFFNIENLTKEDALVVMYIRYLIDLCPKILIITPKNFVINEESLNPWEKSLNPEILFQCNQIDPVVNIKVKSLSEVNSGIEGPEQAMCADGTNFLMSEKKIAVKYLNIVKSEIDLNSQSKSQHFIPFKRSATQKHLIYEEQKEKLFKEWISSLDTIENLQTKIEEECGKFIDIDYYLEFQGFLAEHIEKYRESISKLEEEYQEKIKDSKNQLEAQRILREKQNQALESCLRRFFKWMDVRKNYKSTTFTFPIVSCDIIKANDKPTSFTFKSHRQLGFSLGCNETSEISNISLHFTANSDEGCSGFFMAADKEDNKTSLLCFEFRERENMPLIITKEAEFASADTKMIIDNSLGLILIYDDSTRKASISSIQKKRKFEKFLDANLYKEAPLGLSKPLEKILGGCFLPDKNSILIFGQNYTLLEYEYMSKTLKTVQHQINENGHLKESAVRPKNTTDRYTEAQSFATGKFVILKCKTTLDIYDMNWKLITSVIISRQFRAFKLFSQGTDTYLIIQEANALLVYLLSESLDSLSYKALADEPCEVPKGNPILDVFYLAYKQFGPHFHFMGSPSRTEIILLSESSNFSSQMALDYFEDLGCHRMDLKVNKGIAISSFGFEHLNLFSEENLVRSTSLSFILTTRIPAQCVRIEDSCIVPLINHKDVSKKISQLIRSRSKDLNTLANIINTIKLGVYDKLISSTETAFKVVSIAGNKDANQSHILNRLFGSRFDVNPEKYNDDIWITMCRIKEQNFLVIDFRSILSFEMKEQEKFKLSLTLAALSDVLILNQDLTFGNKVKDFYKYFRQMAGRINRADLFKGSLHIFINGVENSEQKNACQEIVDNFTIRMHKIKNGFLSKLFPGQIKLQALHPFTEASVDKELEKMRSNLLNNIPYRWFNGREVLETFKTLLGQASLDDYIDIKITKPRLAYLRWVEEYCLEDDLGNVDDMDTKLVYKSHEQNNQGKVSYKYTLMLESPQDFTLYSIAMKLNEIERLYIENKTNTQLEEIFNNWAKIFNKIYTENTQLRKYDEQGNCLLDFLSKLDDEEYQNQKKFYISDIRNFFLQKVMNAAYGLSNFLERFITQFIKPTSKVAEYIMVLLRGEALWKFAIQFYRTLYSLTGDSVLVEKLLFPNFTHHFRNKFGDFLQNQINYVKAFFESCEFNLAPTRQNITSIGNYKTYYTMLSNLHLWFINIRNDYAKFGVCIPPILELTKDFLDILELICPRDAPEVLNEITKNVTFGSAGYAIMCPLIDDFLEVKKGELKKDDQYKVANFQAGSLFRHWILYHNKDQLDDLIKRLVERVNNDRNFPNFCTPIFKLIMPQKNFSTITEIFAALEKPENLLSSLVTHIKDNKELDCSNNLSIILTDYFSQILVDPKIESETKSSTKLVEDYQNFLLYAEILENQKCNDIQLLAILAFFRHYLSCYVECFLESYNSQTMRDVDFILNKGSRLTNSLCIYCMKKLRLQQSSFKNLEKLLYDIKKADWPQRFQAQFSSTGKSSHYIPLLSKNEIEIRIEKKWTKLKNTAFNKKELFKELITEAGTNHYTQYQVLSLFLQDVYTGAIGPGNLESLKALMRSEHVLIINSFNKYQCTLLNCYVDQCVNKHSLHIGPDPESHDIHLQMAILNAANWLVSLNRFNSPWTSLFFKNGVVPNSFIAHYNNQFVIGNQDAVIENLPYEYDFYKTNGSFSFLPDNMNSSQKKGSLSTEDTEIYRRLTTTHSSYAFSNDETIAINSITKITTDFLQFLFYASLYVFTSLNWISSEHALQVVDAGTIDTILAYLKDKIICNIIGLNNRLEYKEDPISWVIGLQQMLPQIIEEKNLVGNYHNISYRNRQNFVMQVQRLISDNKNKTTSYLYTLDSILCEQIMPSDYHFINLLRVTKVPCFEDMALYVNLIKSRYILLEKCRERIQDLEEIAKLSSIIDFSNDVMRFADYQITQEDAESLKIADFIATMSNEKQYSMKLKLAEFLKAWNTLDFKNSCLSKSRALRPIEQYNENSPVIAFITSSHNRSGQLSRMISLLSEKQNQFLEEIVGIIRNLKEIKEYNFLNNDLYLPQSVNPEGILNITKDIKFNHIFSLGCSCDYKYGNGEVVIFDFETIQSKLLAEIMKKKKLIIDPDLYPSIHFLGEFAKQDKFEEEVLKLRRLNPGNPITDSLKLKEEFNELQRGKPKLFEVKLKQLQGSLEKIMMLYNMSPQKNITLTHFAQNHCFDAMSPVLTEEMSIKYSDISYLISLYELVEEVMIRGIWDKILHRNFRMTATAIREIETKAITDWLKNIKSNSHSIKLQDINAAISRFVSRCLAFSDLPYDSALKNYLFKRKDYWTHNIPEKQIQSIEETFPRITLAQIGDFQRLIESVQQNRNTQSSRPTNTPKAQVFM